MAMNLAAMAAALVAWLALSRALPAAPCWSLFFLVAPIAWTMWVGQREYALFRHRTHLVAATHEASRIRRWFWRGSIASNLQLLSALSWATVLLALAPLLGAWQAGLLALDAVVLAIAAGRVRRAMAGDIRAEVIGTLSRRALLFANVAFLAAGLFVIDYFIAGSPDTRGLAWHAVAERAYAAQAASFACPLAGAVVGAIAAVDELGWHAAQVLIPSLANPWLNVAAWGVFLLQAGALAFACTRLLLGALAVGEDRPANERDDDRRSFPALLPVLAAISLLAAYALSEFDPSAVRRQAAQWVESANPCRVQAGELTALRRDLGGEIEQARAARQDRASREVDQLLEATFGEAEKGVETYLDWYFSLVGEYSRLAAWAGGLASDRVQARMASKLEERLFGDAGIGKRLAEGNERIAEGTRVAMASRAAHIATRLEADASLKPCWADALQRPAIPHIERDVLRASVAASGGIAAGVAMRAALAGRLSRAAATRLASASAFRGAAGVATKQPVRRAGALVISAAGTALGACAPGGPLAVFCSIAAGAAAWVTIDKVMIEIDELRFREQMREEILGALRAQKEELAAEMRAAHAAYLDALAQGLAGSVDAVFVPARDGRALRPAS